MSAMLPVSQGGHVFVSRSDITRLRCNAWLLPTDQWLSVTSSWRSRYVGNLDHDLQSQHVPERWSARGSQRALPIEPWHRGQGRAPAPIPVLTDVGAHASTHIDWYLDGLSAFIEASLAIENHDDAWRKKRLFAVPLIGTGAGGKAGQKGELQRAILGRLEREAERHDIDLVLVLANDAGYTAAQMVRQREITWPLEATELAHLDRLADHARRGRLVLFLGAGLSYAAGLPLWKDLIEQLCALDGTADANAVCGLPLLDAAAILQRRYAGRMPDFKAQTALLTTTACFGLGHALIASLPVTERITTNYDTCIEDSLEAAGTTVSVLPFTPGANAGNWLLKLHGSVTDPAGIVITRRDYLRYDGQRGALYGIVQAMMFTRHLLFVGFSLKDDNFHALVDEVRVALEGQEHTEPRVRSEPSPPKQSTPFGTAFFSGENPTMGELWSREVEMTPLGDRETYSRQLEIALDYLACHTASSASYLLDDSFSAILDADQVRLKHVILQLRDGIRDIDTATADAVRALLAHYGQVGAG